MGAMPVLGALYPSDFTSALYTQPGGPGTIVYPQQTIGEKNSLWSAGCGHFFNEWCVSRTSYTDNGNVVHTVSLVTCSICGFLVQIIDPFWLIYTPSFEFIMG